MKTILLSAVCVIFSAMAAMAQASKKVVIQTPSVQCSMCKSKIESYLKREPGIQAVNVDFKKKTTTVTYITDRNNIEQIKTAIANVGYDAEDVTAEESAYKKLPKCCKKPDTQLTPAKEEEKP